MTGNRLRVTLTPTNPIASEEFMLLQLYGVTRFPGENTLEYSADGMFTDHGIRVFMNGDGEFTGWYSKLICDLGLRL